MPIYWHVVDSKVMGTTKREQASLFYVIPTDEGRHPHEFYIGYMGDEMDALHLPKGPANPISKVKQLAPIPQYVMAELNMLGRCDGPLEVSAGAYRNQVRFSLHNSAAKKSAALRTSVDTGKWAQGEGFFINCARRVFKLDGYIAMTKAEDPGSTNKAGNGTNMEMTEIQKAGPQYSTACLTSIKNHNSKGTWMVFRLLPGEHKELKKDPPKKVTSKQGELTKPPVDFGSNPFYLGDDWDFQYLFGALDGQSTPSSDKDANTKTSSGDEKALSMPSQQTDIIAEIHV